MASLPYIELLMEEIEDLHGCNSEHVESVFVHEVFHGQTVWKGMVEVFELAGHPKAKRAFAWSHPGGTRTKDERIVVVLEIPPVVSAQTAVHAIVTEAKEKH